MDVLFHKMAVIYACIKELTTCCFLVVNCNFHVYMLTSIFIVMCDQCLVRVICVDRNAGVGVL